MCKPLLASIILRGCVDTQLVSGAYLGFCQGGCTFLADLPPPGSRSGSGSRFWAGSGSGSASKQCGFTALGPLFFHYLIRNCFVKRTKNKMAKKKVIKIKGTVSRDLLPLSFPLQSMQCCGSGMFIPDPDFYPSWIPDLGSRIQKHQQKRWVKKKFVIVLFYVVTNFTKLNLILLSKCWRKKKLGQFSKNYWSFYPKNFH